MMPLVLVALVGEYSLLIMPFILGAMMSEFHLAETRAGQLVSLQLLMMAVASITVSARLRPGQSVRALLAAAILLIAMANAVCALPGTTAWMLAVARAATGLGEGTVMATAAAVVASTADPHRVFSMIGTAVAIIAALALVATPWLMTVTGARSIFWVLTAVPLLLLPSLSRIQRLKQPDGTSNGAALPARSRWSDMILLLAFLLLWCGASGLWVYAERIGAYLGLTSTQIGLWLGIGQLAGIAGPLAAAWAGPRLGSRGSLVPGCLGMAVAAVLFVYGGNAWLYGIGGCLASFWIMFVVPCFRSRMAAVDPSGRTVAASAGFYTVGFGVAPLIVAAITVPEQGYTPVAILCITCFVVAAALAATDARRANAV